MFHSDPSLDPIRAATHADPYGYYASLRAGPALPFDPALGLWIASRAEVVAEVLSHPALRVRPIGEPTPRAIAGLPAGDIFARLIRMNDGPLHATYRPVFERALAGLDSGRIRGTALRVARLLPQGDLNDWCLAMPVCTVASLLGFDDGDLTPLADWTRDFVACLSPLSNAAELQAASAAAHALLKRFETLVGRGSIQRDTLLSGVWAAAHGSGPTDSRVLLANLIGLLSQTCEATAGLLGNALLAIDRAPDLLAGLQAGGHSYADVIAEVARHDAPVQNTLRYVADAVCIAEQALEPGDAILVLLAAANRDAALNGHPDRFRVLRPLRRMFGFGHGAHRCPGQALALTLAAAGLETLASNAPRLGDTVRRGHSYRPSVNARIPVFVTTQDR